jgi:hypothetical protein
VEGLIWWKYYLVIYEIGEMKPVETVPGTGEGRIKENDGGDEFNYDLL